MLERAREIKIIGAGARDRDAHPVAVDLLDGLERRVHGHDVGALDHDIGRGEVDARGAHGVDRQERDVPGALLRSEEHTSELQSLRHLVCRLLLEKKKKESTNRYTP